MNIHFCIARNCSSLSAEVQVCSVLYIKERKGGGGRGTDWENAT